MASIIGKRRLVYGLFVVLAVLAILSVVLPYLGSDSGLTQLFP